MEQLSFQYPLWMIVFSLSAAILFVFLLYFRVRHFKDLPRWIKYLLGLLRFCSILLISVLLLGPLLKTVVPETKKPSLVFLHDNSRSTGQWLDQNVENWQENINGIQQQLSEKYKVQNYAFGHQIASLTPDSLTYPEEQTNIAKAVEYISDIYEGEHLAAVVMLTDGIYNDGKNPLYASFNHPSPIHTVLLGDTTSQFDLGIKQILNNDIAYLNDELAIQVDIQAIQAAGSQSQLVISKRSTQGWQKVESRSVNISQNEFFQTIEILLPLDQPGVIQYRIELQPLSGEKNRANNSNDIFIEVLDARQNIKVLAHAPHPDLTALKELLSRNKNYEVTISFDEPNETDIRNGDLFIIHNLPSKQNNFRTTIQKLNDLKKPRLFILGNQVSLSAFNDIQDLMTIKGNEGVINEVQGNLVHDFSSFTTDPLLADQLRRYPPLFSPFGEYSSSANLSTLLTQKIGNVETDYPLLSFGEQGGAKTAFLFGEGIWKWKLMDYVERQDFEIVGGLLDKVVTYTSTIEDKRKFRVSTLRNVILENEEIVFRAELYNSNYELINEPDVRLILTNESKEEYSYTFSPHQRAYLLNVGQFAPGTYQYSASTTFNGEEYNATGQFVVKDIQLELHNTRANHNILHALSSQSDGTVFSTTELQNLTLSLIESERSKPILFQNQKIKLLIDYRWLWGLLVLLLTVEWLLRRYHGSTV